jgi:hypothetical protein
MLKDYLLDWCQKEYQSCHSGHCGSYCDNKDYCNHDCDNCLDQVHWYPSQAGRADYTCLNLIFKYVLRFTQKYSQQVASALQLLNLKNYPRYSIFSIGCGGSPDLMAFEELEDGKPIYRNTKSNTKDLGLLPLTSKEMFELAARLVEIASKNNLVVESCAEKINLEQFGIAHGHCIDCGLLEQLLDCKLDLDKDKSQREECGCAASIDIGMYNTCKNTVIFVFFVSKMNETITVFQ